MKTEIVNFFLSIFLGFGIILLLSPLMLYWWIHGNYDHYLWIISGPYPYSNFGGGPFQLVVYLGLFLSGSLLIMLSVASKRLLDRSKKE